MTTPITTIEAAELVVVPVPGGSDARDTSALTRIDAGVASTLVDDAGIDDPDPWRFSRRRRRNTTRDGVGDDSGELVVAAPGDDNGDGATALTRNEAGAPSTLVDAPVSAGASGPAVR